MNKRSSKAKKQSTNPFKLPSFLLSSAAKRSLILCGLSLITGLLIVLAQSDRTFIAVSQGVQQQEDQVIRNFKLPSNPAPAAPAPEPAPEPAPAAPEPAYVAPEPAAPEPAPAIQSAPAPQSAPATAPSSTPSPTPSPTASPTASPSPAATDLPKQDPLKQSDLAVAANAGPPSVYVLDFNRSPAIGNRFRLEGINAESRLGFTRPRSWQVTGAKAIIHFQHSPALLASKSNLIVRINDTNIGSIPLNLKNAQIGEAIVIIPPNLVQDFTEITLVAQQANSEKCNNPTDKELWTEVLSDSKVVLNYQPKAIALDFARFPYPIFDDRALDTTQIKYAQPIKSSAEWLTAASRLQAHLGRLHDFRSMDTTFVKDAKGLTWNDRLIVLGTPDEQPALKDLKLPLPVSNGKFLDANKTAFPNDVGILMLTGASGSANPPVLVVSGNGPEGVLKAAQFLVQPDSAKIGTGQLILVTNQSSGESKSPGKRDWKRFMPGDAKFELSRLLGNDNKPFQDVMVRGSNAPRVEFNFRALPDDQFIRGSSMTLKYSYSAQIDTRKSTVSVFIDNIGIGSKKLTSDNGGISETFTVDLPANLITPNSRIGVDFKLVPRNLEQCGPAIDQQLWGTVHKNTEFNLNREIAVSLPDLKLLTYGYPFAAPQDLSRTAIVLPDNPTPSDVMTLMKFSERLGRISQAETVKQEVYLAGNFPDSVKESKHLVGIGTRDRFPFTEEVFKEKGGFKLMDFVGRGFKQAQIQSLPDSGGVVKSILSPFWKPKSDDGDQRIMLALTAQTEDGMKQIQEVLSKDAWFSQLQGDTTLISANKDTSPYDSNAYQFQTLDQADRRNSENLNPLSRMRRFLQSNWWLLPTGIIGLSVILYGIAQLYLKRVAGDSQA